jgi:hypothetical protein
MPIRIALNDTLPASEALLPYNLAHGSIYFQYFTKARGGSSDPPLSAGFVNPAGAFRDLLILREQRTRGFLWKTFIS